MLGAEIYTYCPEDHVQRHRNIEIKCIVVANVNHEKHNHQHGVVLEGDFRSSRSTFGRKEKAFQCNEEKLQKCYQIAGSWIGSEKNIEMTWQVHANIHTVYKYLTIYSMNTTLLQQPANTKNIAIAAFIVDHRV